MFRPAYWSSWADCLGMVQQRHPTVSACIVQALNFLEFFFFSAVAAAEQQPEGWRCVPDTILPGYQWAPQCVLARTPTVHWGPISGKAVGGPITVQHSSERAETRQTFWVFSFFGGFSGFFWGCLWFSELFVVFRSFFVVFSFFRVFKVFSKFSSCVFRSGVFGCFRVFSGVFGCFGTKQKKVEEEQKEDEEQDKKRRKWRRRRRKRKRRK